jgi:mRNA interferase HigB
VDFGSRGAIPVTALLDHAIEAALKHLPVQPTGRSSQSRAGNAAISRPRLRKPLQRFVTIARAAVWPLFPAVKETFPSTDSAPATGTLIFNIGGNKCRLIASFDFDEQLLMIQNVLTHQEYDREDR